MKTLLRYFLVMLLTGSGLHSKCLAVTISSQNPTLLQFAGDPHVPVFQPGNAGHNVLQTTPPESVANVRYGRDLYGSGNVLYLSHPDYDFHASDPAPDTTSPLIYWTRIQSFVNGSAQYGIMTDLRVTRDLLDELTTQGLIQPETFIDQLAQTMKRGMARPLISIDTEPDDAERTEMFVTALRTRLPQLLTGAVVRDDAELETIKRHWDFFIVSTATLPDAHAVQSAMSWLRSRLPQKPILLLPARPQFHAAIVWACTGTAGIQFGDLPASDPENQIAFRNLRAIGSFIRRFPGGKLRLMPELMSRQVFGAFGIDDTCICMMLNPTAQVEMLLPAGGMGKPNIEPRWYNPSTDENIVAPLLAQPDKPRKLRPPSRDYWLYCEFYAPEVTDKGSTMSLILPEPQDLPDPMEETTGTQGSPL